MPSSLAPMALRLADEAILGLEKPFCRDLTNSGLHGDKDSETWSSCDGEIAEWSSTYRLDGRRDVTCCVPRSEFE